MAGYETWCTILRNADAKDTCPFTRQPLRRRELVKLTHDNIAEYRNMMVGTQGGGRGLHSLTFHLNLSRFGHTSPCPPV
jgi:hypothetical protein